MKKTSHYIQKRVFSYPYLNKYLCSYYFDRMDKIISKIFDVLREEPILNNFFISLSSKVSKLSRNSSLYHYIKVDENDKGIMRNSDLHFLGRNMDLLYNIIKGKPRDYESLRVNRGITINYFEYLLEEMNKYIAIHKEYCKKMEDLKSEYVPELNNIQEKMHQKQDFLRMENFRIYCLYTQISYLLNQYKEIKNSIYNSYLRIVYSESKKIIGGKYKLFSIAFQNGGKGLIKAVDNFDFYRGYSFKTYASSWIRKIIIEELEKEVNEVIVPNSVWRKYTKFEKVRGSIEDIDCTFIAQKFNCPMKTVEKIYETMESRKVKYLDAPIGSDDEGIRYTNLLDLIPQNTFDVEAEEVLPFGTVENTVGKNIMNLYMGSINVNESKIHSNNVRDEKVRQIIYYLWRKKNGKEY